MSTEQELKLKLASKYDLERVISVLPGFRRTRDQLNCYYDFPDRRLDRARVMLRLRSEGSARTLTLKQGAVRDDRGYFRARELEETLPEKIETLSDYFEVRPDSEILSELSSFGGIQDLEVWGVTRNLRKIFDLSPEVVVEADHTRYGEEPGPLDEDFELEIETSQPGHARELLDHFLQRVGVDVSPQTKTKSERLKERSQN